MVDRSLDARLQEVWARHLPDTRRRVAVVVDASLSIESGSCTTSERELAGAAAHQLVGLAATFGRPRLAGVAREAERLLRDPGLTPVGAVELVRVARQLAELVGPRMGEDATPTP